MKNKIKYFVLYPLMLLIVILVMTYDVKELISLGQRIPFGSSYWKDSLSDAISTNKSIKLGTGDSLYYNGVVVTSGSSSGIAASDNITFTGRDSTTDLWRFGDSVRFYDHVLFKDTLKVSNAIAIFDSAKISVDVSMLSDSSGINWTSGGLSQIYQLPSPASILAFKQNEFDFFTKKGNQILYLDSLNGMTLNYGVYTGNGSGLTSVDAITLKGQDTSKFARTDTLITEDIKGKWNFWNVVRCIGVVTFDVSPIFNSLVNFANGISTTTLTASSTATFNGDMVPAGWVKNQSSVSAYQYEKTKIVGMKLSASLAVTTTAAHGITDWHTIKSYDISVHDDSSNTVIHPNTYSNDISSVGKLYNICWVDSLNINLRVPATGVNLTSDSAFFTIRYVDFNR